MDVLVTGGTGLVGGALADALVTRGDRVTIATRDVERARTTRNDVAFENWPTDVSRFDAIVHLAGESVAGKRWNEAVKARLRASRVDTTKQLVQAIERSSKRPRVLVCASAVGYYGDRGEELLPEDAPPADSFLAQLCVEWERAALAAERSGVRAVSLRIGIVLGRGGALRQMRPIFALGLGGPFGSGRAWFPWIHGHDLTRLILFALDDATLRGPLNCVSPGIVRNKEFARTLGRVLSRPALLPVPQFALRIAVGEMASVLVASQRCVPQRSLDAGFTFEHVALEPALRSALADLRRGS